MPKSAKNKDFSLTNASITEWLVRALVAVMIFMGVGMLDDLEAVSAQISMLSDDLKTREIESEYFKQDMEEIKELLKKPRFTLEDFEQGIKPIIKQLNANTDVLQTRASFIKETNTQLLKLDLRVQSLEK